jgi:large subunit ribosomal protein L18
MNKRKILNEIRLRRKRRIRRKIKGTAERPRLSVFRSNRHIYAQLIDDINQKTLFSASSKEFEKKVKKSDLAREVGKVLAKKALEGGVKLAVFDRGCYKYHGRVKNLAEGAKEGGLKF